MKLSNYLILNIQYIFTVNVIQSGLNTYTNHTSSHSPLLICEPGKVILHMSVGTGVAAIYPGRGA